MVIDSVGEIVIYALAAAQGVSVGLMLGVASGSSRRGAMYTAGVLVVGVMVAAGLLLGSGAPWIGPIFGCVTTVTSILAAATSLGADPAMRGEPFGQRIVFVLSRRPVPRRSNRRDAGRSDRQWPR